MRSRLNDKVAVVTGSTRGIGEAIVRRLAAEGARVVVSGIDSADGARVAREIGATYVDADVRSPARCESLIDEVVREHGRIDVLVNNAGMASAGVSEAFTSEQAKVLFNTNVVGVLRTTRAVLPAMRAAGNGLIINIGSVLGRVTFPFFGIYGASKFAVEALTDSFRYELSQLGVDVVLVQPSAYPTNMYASIQQPADAARAAAYGTIGEIPGKLFATFNGMFSAAGAPNPHDVAAAIAALVALPKGGRPARTVVGQPFGSDVVNTATAALQQGVVEALGLGHLATLKV